MTKQLHDRKKQGAPSVRRAFDILSLISQSRVGVSLSEVSTALKIPKSSTYVVLDTMAELGVIFRRDTGRYTIGLRLFELGATYGGDVNLGSEFSAFGCRVAEATGETVQLAVLDGKDVVYIGKLEGRQPVRLVSTVGGRLPAYATALGKVLLAHLPPEQLTRHTPEEPFPAFTGKTVRSRIALAAELRAVRRQGYAVDREEVLAGLHCVAAPIRDSGGRVMAGISVSLPTERFLRTGEEALARLVFASAAEISRRLGYVGASLSNGGCVGGRERAFETRDPGV